MYCTVKPCIVVTSVKQTTCVYGYPTTLPNDFLLQKCRNLFSHIIIQATMAKF